MNMRRRLPNDAGDVSSLLCRWLLSATGARIVCKGLESSPERGIHAILRQRYTGQPAGLERRLQPVLLYCCHAKLLAMMMFSFIERNRTGPLRFSVAGRIRLYACFKCHHES
jgi:hypothetical protein